MTQSSRTDKFVPPNLDLDADRTTNAASASDPPPPSIPTNAEIEHFDVLLEAVAVRLRLAADDARTETIATNAEEALQRLRATVLQCVEALEQLQATQRYARGLGDESGAR